MPDLTYENFYFCITCREFEIKIPGGKGSIYTVKFDKFSHRNIDSIQYDYSCSCKSYEYGHGKYCKHIKEVIEGNVHCKWTQYTDGGKPKDGSCPNCGEAVFVERMGV